jgi:hypothetical protein
VLKEYKIMDKITMSDAAKQFIKICMEKGRYDGDMSYHLSFDDARGLLLNFNELLDMKLKPSYIYIFSDIIISTSTRCVIVTLNPHLLSCLLPLLD